MRVFCEGLEMLAREAIECCNSSLMRDSGQNSDVRILIKMQMVRPLSGIFSWKHGFCLDYFSFAAEAKCSTFNIKEGKFYLAYNFWRLCQGTVTYTKGQAKGNSSWKLEDSKRNKGGAQRQEFFCPLYCM